MDTKHPRERCSIYLGSSYEEWRTEAQKLGMSDEDFAGFLLQLSKYTDESNPDSIREEITTFGLKEFSMCIKEKQADNGAPADCNYLNDTSVDVGRHIDEWRNRKISWSMDDCKCASYLLKLWRYISVRTPQIGLLAESYPQTNDSNLAYVTVATDNNYALGGLVLGLSLRQVRTIHNLVILVTPEVSQSIRAKLSTVYDEVIDVTVLDSCDQVHLDLLGRPELGKTFTKLHIWKLTQYEKCVFLDADTLVIKNCDELFERDELSAVPDVGWPDCFNSGVFVFVPSEETFFKLLKLAVDQGSFDGGDQGLLNSYFCNWPTQDISSHLSFIYNMVTSSTYTYLPAYKHFGHKVKILHFLGTLKPWDHIHKVDIDTFEPCENCVSCIDHLKMWWEVYKKHIGCLPNQDDVNLCKEMSDLVTEDKQFELIRTDSHFVHTQEPPSPQRSDWEQGRMDYMGVDCFANIQRKLDYSINTSPKKKK